MARKSLIYFLVGNVIAGVSYPMTSLALRDFSPVDLVLWRTVLAVVLFAPWTARALRKSIALEDWLRIGAVATLGYAAPLLIGTIGLNTSNATNAVLLNAVEPLSIVLLSAAFLGERLTRRRAASIVIGFVGASAIVSQGFSPAAAASPSFRGDVLLALTGALWALHSVIGKHVLRRVDAMSFTSLTITMSLAPFLICALAEGPRAAAVRRPESWFWLAALGVGVTFLATLLWNLALEGAEASALAGLIFVQPLIGVFASHIMTHDRLTGWTGLGGALILVGVFMASREESDFADPSPQGGYGAEKVI